MRFEILIDKRENKRQCTIHPLRLRPDFSISYFDRGKSALPPLQSAVLLHTEGQSLEEWGRENSRVNSVALIDCTWKKVPLVMARLTPPLPTLVKIPGSFQTAYPRKSKQEGLDPEGGLATIEALFITAAFLGNWDETLLDAYYFKSAFLEVNSAAWARFALGPKGKSWTQP